MSKINQDSTSKLSYREAGVDIDKADNLVKAIKQIAKKTHRKEIIAGIGGFGALFEIPLDRYQQPVLVSGTDGVGTKLKLAVEMNQHKTIGIDLVAMCVNDIITCGAEPLFFLDYFATGQLNLEQAKKMMQGIGRGCELGQLALIGGETAELPGMYSGNDYDLAGFCVGIVEKNQIIDGKKVMPGDSIIALASSGPHSNGYSLIRKIIEKSHSSLNQSFDKTTLGEALLTPTRIYAPTIQALLPSEAIHAIAHITGGGLIDNIPRVLPDATAAIIDQKSWEWPEIFKWLQKKGDVEKQEMIHTFNLGVGMVLIVEKNSTQSLLKALKKAEEKAWVIGEVKQASPSTSRVLFQ